MGFIEQALEFAKFYSIYRQSSTLTEYEMLAHEQACNLVEAYFRKMKQAMDGTGTNPREDSTSHPDGTTNPSI